MKNITEDKLKVGRVKEKGKREKMKLTEADLV